MLFLSISCRFPHVHKKVLLLTGTSRSSSHFPVKTPKSLFSQLNIFLKRIRFRTKRERSISSENTSFFFQHFLLAGFRKLSQFFLRCLIQILRYLNLDNCIFIPMDILIFHRYNAFAPQTDLTSGLCTRTDTADHVSG